MTRDRLRRRLRLVVLALALAALAVVLALRPNYYVTRKIAEMEAARLASPAYRGRPWATRAFVHSTLAFWLERDLRYPVTDGCGCRLVEDHAGPGPQTWRDGLRVTVRPASWPPARLTLWCVGGSTTGCAEVPDALTWPSLLQAQLGPAWQVVNLGVGGASSPAEAALVAHLLALGAPAAPDVVVVYDGVNDVAHAHELGVDARAWACGPWRLAHAQIATLLAARRAPVVSIVQGVRSLDARRPIDYQAGLSALLAADASALDGRHIMPTEDVYLDGCHCNDTGNAAIASFVACALVSSRP